MLRCHTTAFWQSFTMGLRPVFIARISRRSTGAANTFLTASPLCPGRESCSRSERLPLASPLPELRRETSPLIPWTYVLRGGDTRREGFYILSYGSSPNDKVVYITWGCHTKGLTGVVYIIYTTAVFPQVSMTPYATVFRRVLSSLVYII